MQKSILDELQALTRILERERMARKDAELIFERKATELIKSQQQLLLSNQTLAEKVKESTEETQNYNNKLIAANTTLRHLISNLQFGILLANENNIVQYANERFCQFFNFSRPVEEIPGLEINEILDFLDDKTISNDNQLSLSDSIFLKISKKKLVNGDLIYMKNGKVLKFDFLPIKQEYDFRGHIWVFHDETDIFEARKKLAAQQKFLEVILDNIPLEIILFDENKNYLYVNPLGEPNADVRKNIVNKNLLDGFTEFTNNKFRDRSIVLNKFYQVDSTLDKVIWEEIQNKDTTNEKTILRQIIPIIDQFNSIKYYLKFGIDISDRIKAEQEIQLAKQLTNDANNIKENFLANISHEIRTPMSGIIGVAGLLGKTQLDAKQSNFLKMIEDSANNLLVVVNDVLDFEKTTSGKIQIENIPFKLVEKIEGIIETFRYKCEEKGLAIYFENVIPKDLVVVGDPYRLTQIFNNLISNAIKFTDLGFVSVSSKVETINELDIFEFTVSDSGIGISTEMLNKIFEPFSQADASISRLYGGTGLGLAICKNLLHIQGGEIKVESEKLKGTNFTFKIPYNIDKNAIHFVKEEDIEINYKSLGLKKVLVVDDVEINQSLARHIFEAWDISVDIAENGIIALDKIQNENYDCVFMDIQMPEMDGLQATKILRSFLNPAKANIPVVALTANALKGDSKKYLDIGMNAYLAKPFTEKSLYLTLSQLFNSENKKELNDNEHNTEKNEVHPKLYDLTIIEQISRGNDGFVQMMVSKFIENTGDDLITLINFGKSGDWSNVSKTAHKMKSVIEAMGIHSIKNQVKEIEILGKLNQDVEKIPALIEEVEHILKICFEQLKSEQ